MMARVRFREECFLRKKTVFFGQEGAGSIPAKNRALFREIYLRQSLPAAGIIEESESARGERGRVGQGRVGFRV